jgi:hypothetical protein
MPKDIYTTNTSFYVPPYIDSLTVDCIGAGGAGGSAESDSTLNYSAAAGGGSGGTFVRGFFSVSPFNAASIIVGQATTTSGGTGNATIASYGGISRVVAVGGIGGESVAANTIGTVIGVGGIASTDFCVGSLIRSGGNGASGSTLLVIPEFTDRGVGGGGGGAAGNDANGLPGVLGIGGSGGAGGGGAGGNGANDNGGAGIAGSAPGGGGGGASIKFGESTGASPNEGGAGARGQATLYYDDVVYFAFTSSTDSIFTIPDGVTEVTIECWGAGGAGGLASPGFLQQGAGGGGAGGNYSRKAQTVSPGDVLYITAPSATTTNSGTGGSALVKLNSTGATPFVVATGGAGGGAGSGGALGGGGVSSTLGCVGSVIISGGSGSAGSRAGTGRGGVGGGGAGNINAGTDASGATPGTGGIFLGGNGSLVQNGAGNGNSGDNYGGGGGGACSGTSGPSYDGGAGARGLVLVWYKPVNPDSFFMFFEPS